MGGNNQIIKPSDERILAGLKKQQKEDHERNRSGIWTQETMCRAIVITALLQDGKVVKEDIREKLEKNQYLPPDLTDELDNVWEEVEAMAT
jgi:hypothetical protein